MQIIHVKIPSPCSYRSHYKYVELMSRDTSAPSSAGDPPFPVTSPLGRSWCATQTAAHPFLPRQSGVRLARTLRPSPVRGGRAGCSTAGPRAGQTRAECRRVRQTAGSFQTGGRRPARRRDARLSGAGTGHSRDSDELMRPERENEEEEFG